MEYLGQEVFTTQGITRNLFVERVKRLKTHGLRILASQPVRIEDYFENFSTLKAFLAIEQWVVQYSRT